MHNDSKLTAMSVLMMGDLVSPLTAICGDNWGEGPPAFSIGSDTSSKLLSGQMRGEVR